MIRLQPGADGQGLSISMRPIYGNAKRLWQQDTIHVDNDQDYYNTRMEIRVGYGFPALWGGLLIPYSEMTLGTLDNCNCYALGLRWQPNSQFDLDQGSCSCIGINTTDDESFGDDAASKRTDFVKAV